MMNKEIEIIESGLFESDRHWYPSAHNAVLHPMVHHFINMSAEQIAYRYCHLHPKVDHDVVMDLLQYKPNYFFHSGTDLIHAATEDGRREMVVIETNSSPSGQKSMPTPSEGDEMGGYRTYVKNTFVPYLKSKRTIKGVLAVIYDKNYMEASGYAHAMAEEFQETVYLVPCFHQEEGSELFYKDGALRFKLNDEEIAIRACFRYVTQKPWSRLPLIGRTVVLNPVITCLAGGRNKLVASKAYELFNADHKEANLKIVTPETIWDVEKSEIPLWVRQMGGKAVIKIPYSNAGQGVYTIVNEEELEKFMSIEFEYEKFIVQSLIGNHAWSSELTGGKLYHVGTVPTKKRLSYAMDIRMIIQHTPEGYKPLSLYSRRAEKPLAKDIASGDESWSILGTNLSIAEGKNLWSSDVSRLMMMDTKGFNKLGIGLDSLIDGFLQSVMATKAIDQMAIQLIGSKGKLRKKLFKSLNNDQTLINEIAYAD